MSDEDDLSGEINPIVSSQQQSVASRLTSFFGKRNNRQHQQLNIAELNSNKSNEDTASVTSFTEMKKRSSILSGTNPAFQLKGLFSPKNKSSSSRSKKSQGSGIEMKDGIDYWTDYYLENEVGEDDDAADPCDFENDLRNDEMTRKLEQDAQTDLNKYGFGFSKNPFQTSFFCHGLKSVNCVDCCRLLETKQLIGLSGGGDKKVIVWNFTDFKPIVEMEGHSEAVMAVACKCYNRTDLYFVSGGEDNSVIIWDPVTYRPRLMLSYHTDVVWVVHLEYLPKLHHSPMVFSSSRDRTVVCWDARSGDVLRVYSGVHTAGISAVAVCVGHDPLVISGGNDGLVVVWDWSTTKVLHQLSGHTWPVTGVACYFPEGFCEAIIVSTSMDKKIILWDMSARKAARSIECERVIRTMQLLEPQNGDMPVIFTGDMGGNICMFDLFTGKLKRRMLTDPGVKHVAIVDSEELLGPMILSCGSEGKINIYDLAAKDQIRNTRTAHKTELSAAAWYCPTRGEDNCARSVVATTSLGGKRIVVWNSQGIRMCNLWKGHNDHITALAFNDPLENERLLLMSGSWDSNICVWDVYAGQLVRTLSGHDFRVMSLSYARSCDGSQQYLVSGAMVKTKESNCAVCVWDLNTMEMVYSENPSAKNVVGVHLYAPTPNFHPAESLWGSTKFIAIVALETTKIVAIDLDTKAKMVLAANDTDVNNIQLVMTVYEHEDKREAYLIGGGHTNNILIWNLLTGEIIFQLRGHIDTISALATFRSPNYGLGHPILISGSCDATIKLWELTTGTNIQTRYNHRSKIILLQARQMSHQRYPFLGSICVNKFIYIHDMSYTCNMMAPRGFVAQSFELDRLDHDGRWSRIERISNRFGTSFWLENSYLIAFAVWYKDITFTVKFKEQIRQCIRSARLYVAGQSLLQYIISFGSIILMKLVLSFWSELLNAPIRDYADQHFFNLCYFIRVEDLLLLAKSYPTEFSEFICSIKLRPAHSSMNPKYYRYNMDATDILIATCLQRETKTLWDKLLDPAKAENGQPVSVLFLPLVGSTDTRMITAYCEVANRLGSVDIFNSDVGTLALRSVWRTYGKKLHLKSFSKYVVFTVVYAIAVFSFDFCIHYSLASKIITLTLHAATLIAIVYYIYEEYLQFRYEDVTLFDHVFGDMWNTMDAISFAGAFVGIIIRLSYMTDTDVSRSILAVSSVFVWFKVLYYLRAFSSSGPLSKCRMDDVVRMHSIILIVLVMCSIDDHPYR
jgi:WD40 repeat protein